MGMVLLSRAGFPATRLIPLDVPSQPLSAALHQLARQSGVQIIYFSEVLNDKPAPAIKGQFSVEEALTVLLQGTGLAFRSLDDGFMFIEAAPEAASARRPARERNGTSAPPRVDGEVEAIIVTARRREESLMDVPFSIDALSRYEIAQRNIDNVLVANGHFRNVSIRTNPFSGAAGLEIGMRGINKAVLYQDGVPIRFGALPNTLDVERIEVMRGPQGTLFGPSAIAGAIQTVTARPGESFFGAVDITVGSLDRHDVGARLNLPLGEGLAVSLTAASLNRDGFVESTATGQALGSKRDRYFRFDSMWEPLPDSRLRVQYARLFNGSNGQAYVNYRLDAVCPGDPVPQGYLNSAGEQRFFAPNAYCILSRLDLDPAQPGTQPYTTEFHSFGQQEVYANTIRSADMGWWQRISDAKVDWESRFGDGSSIRAIFSRRWGTENSAEDLDGTGLDIFQNNLNQLQEQWDQRTAEIQYLYDAGRVTGIVGVYAEQVPGALQKRLSWVHNELTIPEIAAAAEAAFPGSTDFRIRPESAPFNTAEFFRITRISTTQWAAFTEWSWSATEQLKLTGGIRFTRQNTKRTRYRPGAAGAAHLPPVRCCDLDPQLDYFEPAGPAERSRLPAFSQWTPRISVQYSWQPEVMTYLSYAKGGSPGGVDISPAPGAENNAYRPETVHTLESGFRARTPAGTTQIHVGGFISRYRDVQVVEEIFPGALRTGNAAARIYGLEVQGSTSVAPWRFDYGLGWLRARYTGTGSTVNLSESTPFAYAPELSLSAGISFEKKTTRYDVLARIDHTWQGRTTTSTDPTLAQPVPSRGLLGARVELRPMVGNWYLALSGSNLTEEFYFTSGFLLPADQSFAGTMGRPREWALTLGARFD